MTVSHGMLQRSRYEDYWFLPGSDDQGPGTLEFRPDDEVLLSLNGTLGVDQWTSEKARYPVIFGLTDRGRHVSAHRCLLTAGQFSIPGYGTERYIPTLVFVGRHFIPVETRFKAISISYWNLEECINASGLSPLDYHGTSITLGWKMPPDAVAQLDDYELRFHNAGRVEKNDFTGKSIRQDASIRIVASEPQEIGHFLEGPCRSRVPFG